MNYYEHHINDYAEATSHLSWLEDAAYSRMLRKYYAKEAPLPADIKAVQRLVRATSKEEGAAVETVLREFFVLMDDGWHQETCDEVIADYQAGEPEREAEREAKRVNKESRTKKHREERSKMFAALAQVGQHPQWNIKMPALRHIYERYCVKPVTAPETDEALQVATPETQPVTAPVTPATHLERTSNVSETATHSPFPINQSQVSESDSDTSSNSVRASLSDTGRDTRALDSKPGGKGADLSEAEHHAKFERLKAAYPRFAGRQDWITVEHLCRQLVETGQATWDQLIAAAERYAKFCEAGGVSGPTFVLTPAKFFGAADKPWKQDWAIGPTEKPRDRALEAEWRRLEGDASRIGFRSRVGTETPDQFRAALKLYENQQASKVIEAIPGLGDALKMAGKAS